MKKYNYTVEYKDCKNGDDICLKRKVLNTRSEVASFLNEITEIPLYTASQIDRYFRCPPKNNKIDALRSKFTLRRDPWIKESSA
jgi:hypothetical protein